ncbi:MAG TPA: D-alanyl-D-alanine carboxypeptidase, partial [Solirubrobacterales bacterium]|nr:D-alanyl-D-alanine carboxypeptidase [Solirubrobacterales bacterium]
MRRGAILLALACAALALLASSAQASAVCDQMRGMLTSGGGSASGLLVVEAESGDVVCAKAANRPRLLASNMKLFTTAAALSKLGPDYRMATEVLADGRIDPSGTLRGSLYLQGDGDPTLGTPAFNSSYLAGMGANIFSLVPQIRAAGIRAITGRVYGDDTVFDRLRGVADSGYATSSYIGPLSGLAFNSGFSGSSSSSGFSSDPAKLATKKLARALKA